jgi:hypothetical protein
MRTVGGDLFTLAFFSLGYGCSGKTMQKRESEKVTNIFMKGTGEYVG